MNAHHEFPMTDKQWIVCEHKCMRNKMVVHEDRSRMDDACNNEHGKAAYGRRISQKGISRLLLSSPLTMVDFYNKSR